MSDKQKISMSFEIKGKLVKKYEIESKTATFQTREFVIEINSGNYPEFVKFQLTQDRCSLIDAYKEGDTIKVSFDLRGREWQGKYFTNLNAWRVQADDSETPKQQPAGGAEFPSTADEPVFDSADDDLPF